jgi:hypothetical protein
VVVAATAWCGVLIQLWLSIRAAGANGQSLVAGVVSYFGFFTVITNLFVAIVCTLPSLPWKPWPLGWLSRPTVTGCATTAILLVGIVYHFLLRELWAPRGLQWLVDLIQHYLVPAGVLSWWIMTEHRSELAWDMPLRWCSYPFIYLGYVMVRGEIIGSYPYPFINAEGIGHLRALLNASGLILAYMALGFMVRGFARIRPQPAADAHSSITE